MEHDILIEAMQAAAWEEAKGALRKFIALMGHRTRPGLPQTARYDRYVMVSQKIATFIKEFEDEGYQE